VERLIIDRLEGAVAVCADETGARVELAAEALPGAAKEGDVLVADNDGAFCVDEEQTAARRERLRRRMDRLMKRK